MNTNTSAGMQSSENDTALEHPQIVTDRAEQPSNGANGAEERRYDIIAVIPIEFFTPNNRDKVRNAVNGDQGCFELVFSPSSGDNENNGSDHSRIGRHIKDFSAYEYEIYEMKEEYKKDWSYIVNKIVDKKICAHKLELEKEDCVKKIKEEMKPETEIILAMPFASNESESNDKTANASEGKEKGNSDPKDVSSVENDENFGNEKSKSSKIAADIHENTGIVISIQVSVSHSKTIGNEGMAKFLKSIGDRLNEEINEFLPKNVKSAKLKLSEKLNKKDNKPETIFELIVDLLPFELFSLQNNSSEDSRDQKDSESEQHKDDSKQNSTKYPLHDEIEINYVFTYFICNGFDFYILTDTHQVDDNIKYSGDAWFLNKGKIYRKPEAGQNSTNDYEYISEAYYEAYYKEKQNNSYKEVPDDERHHWLTEVLIPEATIRQKDIYYIPKINGGGLNDYSSVLLKFRNRLCCFVKKDYVEDSNADDKNCIIAMQIVLNSFWHRMIEFSRVMQKLCLANGKIENGKSDSDDAKMIEMEPKMAGMKPGTRSSFLNQVHTTPTLPEQILDINSADQDVLTLHDLAVSSKIESAGNIFSEVKNNFLSIHTGNMNEERAKQAKKAESNIQGMFLVLAIIASAIGLIELWAEWDIDWRLDSIFTAVIVFLIGFCFVWRYREKCRKIIARLKNRNSASEGE